MVLRLEAVVGHALPPWQREVVVHQFTVDEMRKPVRVDSVTS
jgi:hypothetical protein